MQFDASGVAKSSDVKVGSGGFLNEKGGWHFIVTGCDWVEDGEFFSVELEVLAGTIAGHEGEKLTQNYYTTNRDGEPNPGILRFALATRVVQPKSKRELSEDQLAKEVVGRTFKANTYLKKGKQDETKMFCNISLNDQWAVDEDEAKHIPTGTIPAGNGHATNGNGSQDAQPAAAGGGWDDIV